ncbi:sugar phosphate isomerase/epimerase family protein [Mesorhizobium escarrei]|uniref:Sugar phosphate isomerase/epimerase n=1 Tax=Mesorhizobium escarrei TaxID=666018 RepID=A0ABM9E070_9HYPH|nr:sugar phosphate isomerase/epimerase family protein [Mesorhizobium escarrei]CAH2402354.1 Sugar phosphate isomerase/epimerase [Mesorhizobium escarrei]
MTSNISAIGFYNRPSLGDLELFNASLQKVAETGADACEIPIYAEEVVSRGRIMKDRAARITTIVRRYGFKRLSLHGPLISNFMDPEHLDLHKHVMRANLELCDRLGAGLLVQHGGHAYPAPGEDCADYDAMEREALAEMAIVAAGYGVRIGLENIFASADGEYVQSPSDVAAAVRAIGSDHVVAVLDLSHAYIASTARRLNFREELRAMAPVTGHLHVHDSYGLPNTMRKFHRPVEATSYGLGDLHLPIGWGDIPWEPIFSELQFLPDTMLIMEIESDRFADEQPASLERARRLVQLNPAR